jgi:hypothetical protein
MGIAGKKIKNKATIGISDLFHVVNDDSTLQDI